jgi:hypothetical protein
MTAAEEFAWAMKHIGFQGLYDTRRIRLGR